MNYEKNIDLFYAMYTRLASTLDLMENLILALLIKYKKIDSTLDTFLKKTDTITASFEDAKKSIKKYKSYTIPVIRKIDLICEIFKSNELKNAILEFDSIRHYRNLLIHSWPNFQIDSKLPNRKVDSSINYQDWAEMQNKTHEELKNISETDYIDMMILLKNDTNLITETLNKIWGDLILFIKNEKNTI